MLTTRDSKLGDHACLKVHLFSLTFSTQKLVLVEDSCKQGLIGIVLVKGGGGGEGETCPLMRILWEATLKQNWNKKIKNQDESVYASDFSGGKFLQFCEKYIFKIFCCKFSVFLRFFNFKSPQLLRIWKGAKDFEYCWICLNILMDDCHLSNITKLKTKTLIYALVVPNEGFHYTWEASKGNVHGKVLLVFSLCCFIFSI